MQTRPGPDYAGQFRILDEFVQAVAGAFLLREAEVLDGDRRAAESLKAGQFQPMRKDAASQS